MDQRPTRARCFWHGQRLIKRRLLVAPNRDYISRCIGRCSKVVDYRSVPTLEQVKAGLVGENLACPTQSIRGMLV